MTTDPSPIEIRALDSDGFRAAIPGLAALLEVLGDADHRRALVVGELVDLERQAALARSR